MILAKKLKSKHFMKYKHFDLIYLLLRSYSKKIMKYFKISNNAKTKFIKYENI